MSSLKSGFVHTVFFWLKNPESATDLSALEAGLKNLANISLIKSAYIGKPANTNRDVIDSSYSYSITFIFDTEEDQDAYQVHADHYVFIDKCSHLWDRVQVYDAL